MISVANFTAVQFNFTSLQKYGVEPNVTFKINEFENDSNAFANFTEHAEIPYYIRATSMTLCVVIMCLGVIGNVMVPIVILKTKDMRNSTNIFLVNLSIADLMVLLVCTPTVLVEVNSRPETWVLGKELCLAVPFVELTVAHASVLTILAISFERYYAICEPLRAGYVCTKTRAALICFLAWFFAAVFTSPVLAIAEHRLTLEPDGTVSPQCLTQADTVWKAIFFIMISSLLFLIPLIILIVLYSIIAKNLISSASKVVMNKHVDPFNIRARKQVILMLGTVVLCFFICLTPFRILTLWIILSSKESVEELDHELYYNILHFCRVMIYMNSGINPILYNLMSSKFRNGFCRVCCFRKPKTIQSRGKRIRETFNTGSTSSSTFSRTTNSLKQIFSKRSSLDKGVKTETEFETLDLETKKLQEDILPGTQKQVNAHDFILANKPNEIPYELKEIDSGKGWFKNLWQKHLDQHEKMNTQDNVNRLSKIDENFDVSDKSNADIKGKCRTLHIRHKSLEVQGSLRRSVLLNSTKAKSVDVEGDIEEVTIESLKNSVTIIKRRIDKNIPESFV